MTDFQNDDDSNDLLDRLNQISTMLETATRKLDFQSLESIITSMSARLERQLTSQIESLLKDSLTGLLSSAVSGVGGQQQAGVNAVLSAFLPRLAQGGVVDGATSFAIGGEAGPEAVLPLKRLPDGRLGVASEASPNANQKPINIIINTGNTGYSGDQQSVGLTEAPIPLDDLADLISHAIDDAIDTRLTDHRRQGGIFSQIGGGL